jgi:hypothetical protein
MTPKPTEINGLRQKLQDTRRRAMTKLMNDPKRLREIRARAREVARKTVLERLILIEEELEAE